MQREKGNRREEGRCDIRGERGTISEVAMVSLSSSLSLLQSTDVLHTMHYVCVA
jgi:hypothetical protein